MEGNKSFLRIRIKCPKKSPALTDSCDGPKTAHNEGKPPSNGDIDEIAGAEYPKSTSTCQECGKTFRSDKALFGHLRCHPERSYRGAHPPPTATKKRHYSDAQDSAAKLPQPRDIEDHNAKKAAAAHTLITMSRSQPVVIPIGLKTPEGKGIAQKEKMEELEQENAEPGRCGTRYKCNVCLKSFSSHQALGGHIASHGKNKNTNPREETNVYVGLLSQAATISNSPEARGSEYQKEASHDPSPSARSCDQTNPEKASYRVFYFDLNEIPMPQEEEES